MIKKDLSQLFRGVNIERHPNVSDDFIVQTHQGFLKFNGIQF